LGNLAIGKLKASVEFGFSIKQLPNFSIPQSLAQKKRGRLLAAL
jgi:hypothetical protein